MFISTNSLGSKSGSIHELGNVDYQYRYIVIEAKKDGTDAITVYNISSSTGKSLIGVQKNSERNQTTNLYHCTGKVMRGVPSSRESAKSLLDVNAYITVDDISYGIHNYDFNRMKFGELHSSTSYIDIFNEVNKFSLAPNIRFYNNEHHILNQEIANEEFVNGTNYIPKNNKIVEVIQLRELIDKDTMLFFTRSSNFSHYCANTPTDDTGTPIFESDVEDGHMVDLNILTMMVIGPVTDLTLGMLFNTINFNYDSIEGLGKLEYRSNHKYPTNDIYMGQLIGNHTAQFNDAMAHIVDEVGWRFRLFVKSTLGTLHMKILKYDTFNGGFIAKDFELDIGRFRNDQHFDAIHWADTNCEL